MNTFTKKLLLFQTTINKKSFTNNLLISLGISWFYAICSQMVIPLPFNLVPLSIQPLPVMMCTLALGRPAITGYVLYLLQGIAGAPFFASCTAGLSHFAGPTGGYLVGFFFSALFLDSTGNLLKKSRLIAFIQLQGANIITFGCGMMYLSFFVPSSQLLAVGLTPFLCGDFILKTICAMGLLETIRK